MHLSDIIEGRWGRDLRVLLPSIMFPIRSTPRYYPTQPGNQPTNQPTNHPASQPTNQPTKPTKKNKQTNKQTNKQINKPLHFAVSVEATPRSSHFPFFSLSAAPPYSHSHPEFPSSTNLPTNLPAYLHPQLNQQHKFFPSFPPTCLPGLPPQLILPS